MFDLVFKLNKLLWLGWSGDNRDRLKSYFQELLSRFPVQITVFEKVQGADLKAVSRRFNVGRHAYLYERMLGELRKK